MSDAANGQNSNPIRCAIDFILKTLGDVEQYLGLDGEFNKLHFKIALKVLLQKITEISNVFSFNYPLDTPIASSSRKFQHIMSLDQ